MLGMMMPNQWLWETGVLLADWTCLRWRRRCKNGTSSGVFEVGLEGTGAVSRRLVMHTRVTI